MKTKDEGALSLPCIYGSDMVLQRELPVKLTGRARKLANVRVSLDGRAVAETVSGRSGAWKAEIPAQLPGGPHEIEVESGGEKIKLGNVLFGDVWICSGQSNMEWDMARARDAERDIPACANPRIRLFTVTKNALSRKSPDCGGKWLQCTPETLPLFSAVGYYFGKELEENIDVPIGLMNTSWGGTKAEAWTSEEALAANPALKHLLNNPRASKARMDAGYRRIADFRPGREMERNPDGTLPDPGRQDFTAEWSEPACDDSKWVPMELPCDIERHGLDIDGAIWFRRKIEIPERFAGKDLVLSLGVIDDFDTTWFNGVEVGRTGKETANWWSTARRYRIPARLAKAGEATVAVRVFDHFMNGGMMGPLDAMKIHPEGEADKVLGLAGEWLSALELAVKQPQNSNPASTHLFNGMINPLLPLKVKGAIWYQGESNADRAAEYRMLLEAMIRDWRARWNSGEFPFYIVQLANYMKADDEPTESFWAQLRNSQQLVADEVENCGLATAIDIGEADDIHPRNKKDVGRRLALQALRKAYRIKAVHCDGPRLKTARIEGEFIELGFETGGLALKTSDGKPPREFAVRGSGGAFRRADAKIAGSMVLVKIPEGERKPFKLRYAWANNPRVNLYDASGLPALPFETVIK